jgi:Mn-containing catalase
MILRIERLAIELPAPSHPSPNSASAVQELLGGKFGEMSTLMNYTFQSFNFRGRDTMKPFYDLIANIGAEEYGHIEPVSSMLIVWLTSSMWPYSSAPMFAMRS